MSFVVTCGYATPWRDLEEAWAALSARAPAVFEAGAVLKAGHLARQAARIIDRSMVTGTPVDRPLAAPERDWAEDLRRMRSENRRSPHADLDCVLALHPFEGRILATIHAEQERFHEILSESMTHLPWWDNTDRPKEIGEADWLDRRRIWEAVSSRDRFRRLGRAGISLDMSEEHGPSDPDLLLREMPDRRARGYDLAKGWLEMRLLQQMKEAATRDIEISDVARIAGSGPLREAAARLGREIETDLPVITRDDLRDRFVPGHVLAMPPELPAELEALLEDGADRPSPE